MKKDSTNNQIDIDPMREIRNVTKEIRTDTVNGATGEIISSVMQRTSRVEAEPAFVKLYINDLLYLRNIPKGYNNVLLSLLRRMDYNNQIVINSSVKRQIAEESNLSVDRISNSLTSFVKNKVLSRVDKGIYLGNPYLFARGGWDKIKNIRLTINYNPNQTNMFVGIDKEEDDEQLAS